MSPARRQFMGLEEFIARGRRAQAAVDAATAPAPAQTFVVEGPPATKGSTVSLWAAGAGGIITRTDSARLAGWTKAVQWSAKAARVPLVPKPGGVRVEACFVVVAPKDPPAHPTRPPDVDKVARALLDALTGIAYTDDAQVVELRITKRYGPAAETAITIARMP